MTQNSRCAFSEQIKDLGETERRSWQGIKVLSLMLDNVLLLQLYCGWRDVLFYNYVIYS